MYTCPVCQKTHEENKFYCDYCLEFYCSLECLKYQNFPEHDKFGVREMSDLTFNCCGTCYCAKCHSQLMYSGTDEIIRVCELCNRFFHDDCNCEIDPYCGNESCMCKLCIDLQKGEKKIICKACHNQRNIKQFSFADLSDIKQFIQLDSPEWKNLICRHYYGRRAEVEFPDSRTMEHYIGFNFSNCKKYKQLIETFESNRYVLSTAECLFANSIECDCNLCKNIKCKTTFARLMFNDWELNDGSNAWDMGCDLTPVEVLKAIAENPENNCDCEICQFWRAYN